MDNCFFPDSIKGLSESEAEDKLKSEGYNEIVFSEKHSFLNNLLSVLKEPMLILLIICGAVYYLLGEHGEAIVLSVFVIAIISITFYQERKTSRALEALRDMSSPRALVLRGGIQKRIAGREVVEGDAIILFEGDRVPADGELLASSSLLIDESLLTGESVPMRKFASVVDENRGLDREDMLSDSNVYSGTLVVQGSGVARVTAVGASTRMGSIGSRLAKEERQKAPLQVESRRVVKNIAFAGISICVMAVVLYGLTRDQWLEGILAGIALAMAILPEEIPVVLTVFLALGAWRMSKSNVLTRRVSAIETLGAATVLCVDKTGTLTMNRMTVKAIYSNGIYCNIDESEPEALEEGFHELVEYCLLAAKRESPDPIDTAIRTFGETALRKTEHIHGDWQLFREYPLSREMLAISNVWKSSDTESCVIAAKGAPEAISDLCHLSELDKTDIEKTIEIMASDGLKILGVARAYFEDPLLPEDQHAFSFRFCGLIGFEDPLREGVQDSISECREAGIRVIVITGDLPMSAVKIAKETGIDDCRRYLTGVDFDRMDMEEISESVKETNVFARIAPENKLLIVEALIKNGEVTAMTGDGINDAPALKRADIGIAMGKRGTDVAREAASLVLLDDDFSSIVKSVRMGRRIYSNIRKAMVYIIAIHIPIIGIALLPVIFQWPLLLMPIHIAFLELIIDPACSIVFEAEQEEEDVMKRPPRGVSAKLFDKYSLLASIIQGLIVFLFIGGIYAYFMVSDKPAEEARTIAFTSLVFANLFLILINRSWSVSALRSLKRKNTALWWVIAGAFLFLGISIYIPLFANMFSFKSLSLNGLIFSFAAGIFSTFWFEIYKRLNKGLSDEHKDSGHFTGG